MYNPFSLVSKTILITGASSGIGKATAVECAKMGAKLIITGRDVERLNQTMNEIEGNGHLSIVADIAIEDQLEKMISQIPSLDGVVNCAGIMQTVPFGMVDREKLETIMQVNFIAPTLLTKKLLKAKKIAKGASIVFVSSISGVYICYAANSIYSASKGAINGIVKGMAIDLARKQIRVNCVNPGMIETPLYDDDIISREQLDEDKKKYPLGGRYGKPIEVAHAIIYLLSDASSWTTGSNLLLDGGYTLL